MLKILQVLVPALHPNQGGVQMTTCKLGKYFASKGYEALVYSFAKQGHEQPECIRLISAVEPGGVNSRSNLDELASMVDKLRPDIVINHMPYEAKIGDVLSRPANFFLIACLRNTLFSVKGDLDSYIDKVVPHSFRWIFRNTAGRQLLLEQHRKRHSKDLERILVTYDRFVMFGPPNLKELEYFVPGFDQHKIALIPNSIPSVEESVPHKEKRLLWLGRISKSQKRVDLIPEIWSVISQQLNDWQLDVVGDGPDLNYLRSEIDRLELPRVNFYGRQKPDEFYSRSALFFMTSSFEGFPNTLIEAQSHGCVPIVFDSYPVVRWLIEQNRNGVLVPPFDSDAMAEWIVRLATGDDQASMAGFCLDSARQFQIEHVGAMWDSLFEQRFRSTDMDDPNE